MAWAPSSAADNPATVGASNNARRLSSTPSVERTRLTFRRLSGLDRSGPPPKETLREAPWRPWTIPNAITYFRFALLMDLALRMLARRLVAWQERIA